MHDMQDSWDTVQTQTPLKTLFPAYIMGWPEHKMESQTFTFCGSCSILAPSWFGVKWLNETFSHTEDKWETITLLMPNWFLKG